MSLHPLRLLASALLFSVTSSAAGYFVYAGTYTSGRSRGIYGYRFDPRGARLKPLGLLAEISNPTFIVEHPDHRYIYAVSEETGGSVSAFLIDPRNGKLTLVSKVSSGGAGPCHLALDREGRWLAVANCASGGVAIVPLRQDGGLGPPLSHPAITYSSGVIFSPDNRFLLVAHSNPDRISVYSFDVKSGLLSAEPSSLVEVAPEFGVRRLAFHTNGRIVYASNRKHPGLTVWRYDPGTGALTHTQDAPATAPEYQGSETTADLAVNPAGTVVYASIGGIDSMALYAVDPVNFTLSVLETTPLVARNPRHFALDPTGAYLLVANRDSKSLNVYTVHPHSGQIRPIGRPTPPIDAPACVVMVPAI